MMQSLRQMIYGADRWLTGQSLKRGREQPALLTFLFHSLFADAKEAQSGLIDPFQPVTLENFATFIDHFLMRGYRFVSPADLLNGLDPEGRYVLITFDDGYANNLRALPVLRAFDVPACFFVSAHHVSEGKAFWWDVVYRERRRQGQGAAAIEAEQTALKRLAFDAIESKLRREFGPDAFVPITDLDRPMTEAELRDFAADPRVTIGNHTADHAILTVHDDATVGAQIRSGQDFIARITGSSPVIIAYPNGNYDARVVRIARGEGLSLGVVVEPRKTHLPLCDDRAMTIPRYALDGGALTLTQCESCRSDIQLRHGLRRLRRSLAGNPA